MLQGVQWGWKSWKNWKIGNFQKKGLKKLEKYIVSDSERLEKLDFFKMPAVNTSILCSKTTYKNTN